MEGELGQGGSVHVRVKENGFAAICSWREEGRENGREGGRFEHNAPCLASRRTGNGGKKGEREGLGDRDRRHQPVKAPTTSTFFQPGLGVVVM